MHSLWTASRSPGTRRRTGNISQARLTRQKTRDQARRRHCR